MSALLPKAGIAGRGLDVRFVPNADIGRISGPYYFENGDGLTSSILFWGDLRMEPRNKCRWASVVLGSSYVAFGSDARRIATNLCLKITSFERRDLVLEGHGTGYRGHLGSKDRCPCSTNSPINARQPRRIAQPVLRSCGSLE